MAGGNSPEGIHREEIHRGEFTGGRGIHQGGFPGAVSKYG